MGNWKPEAHQPVMLRGSKKLVTDLVMEENSYPYYYYSKIYNLFWYKDGHYLYNGDDHDLDLIKPTDLLASDNPIGPFAWYTYKELNPDTILFSKEKPDNGFDPFLVNAPLYSQERIDADMAEKKELRDIIHNLQKERDATVADLRDVLKQMERFQNYLDSIKD
jgi:hypothetical protein